MESKESGLSALYGKEPLLDLAAIATGQQTEPTADADPTCQQLIRHACSVPTVVVDSFSGIIEWKSHHITLYYVIDIRKPQATLKLKTDKKLLKKSKNIKENKLKKTDYNSSTTEHEWEESGNEEESRIKQGDYVIVKIPGKKNITNLFVLSKK
ncbi:hypothetical protein WA026_002052 [Henosepilachna vigintioctopunctata]|uniref:Uncharacterized protein n=1 Tax=Henosepilachna vigintioctopunctata TaxID=420089 RepID=A0AAW1USN4_9CUCU